MGIGETDFGPPPSARAGLREAADQRMDKYGPTRGLKPLREAIAASLLPRNPCITEKNVMVTSGGTEAVMTAFQSLIDPASEVLVPDPGFVLYSPDALLVDAEPVPYHLIEEEGFQPDIEEIKELIGPRTRGIVVNTPGNPTGGTFSLETVKVLVEIARDNDLVLFSDEVYEHFVYEGEHHSFLPFLDRAVVINSFSKSLGVTGWRVGYLVASAENMNHLAKLSYYDIACPSTPVQYAVLQAVKEIPTFMANHRLEYRKRRDLMVGRLNEIEGVSCTAPRGAFYAFPSYDWDIHCMDLSHLLLKAGVITIPGCAFGEYGEYHLRLSYAISEEAIEKGMDIVEAVFKGLKVPRLSTDQARKGRTC